jgi:hypothetical protein
VVRGGSGDNLLSCTIGTHALVAALTADSKALVADPKAPVPLLEAPDAMLEAAEAPDVAAD